jgi:PhnB protein
MVKPVPDGYNTATPYLYVKGAAAALDFYKKALGAQEIMRMPGPDGKSIMHAELRIGNSIIMLSDEQPGGKMRSPQTLGAATSSVFLYVDNADTLFNQAVAAGAQSLMPVSLMFWGDRFGSLVDPFGHHWNIATHVEDVAPEEMKRRQAKAFSKPAGS